MLGEKSKLLDNACSGESDSARLWTVACQAPLWGFSDKNTGMSCHFLLQGIFWTQGSNPSLLCLLLVKQILYH